LFGSTAVMTIPAPKKQRSLLPLLVVVFLGSYGLMTMLIVEQGSAIQQQHSLIQVLQGDSRELWAIRAKAMADKNAHAQGRNQSRVAPGQSAPSGQTPQHAQNQAGKTAKQKIQLPPVPAADLSDQRRVLITL
jgi:hypothetical protein